MDLIPWREEILFFDTPAYFEKIKESIRQAQKTIDHEVYIYKLDLFGGEVASLLIEAAKRGVKVRLLIDAFGSMAEISDLEHIFLNTGVDLRFFNSFWKSSFFKVLSSYNRRNHRKVWIFDGQKAFVSSANTEATDWKEIGIQILGAETAQLGFAFDKLWQKKYVMNQAEASKIKSF